jgi:acetyltransferase
MGDIRKMFDPENIALIGATEEPGSAGRSLLDNLLFSKERKVFPVNPNRKTVLGLECYPTVKDIPEKIDLSVVATPPPTVPDVVEECGKIEADGIIIISSGFREMGDEGTRLLARIEEIQKKYGMRILGPDCLGIIRPNLGLNASRLKVTLRPGNIALVAQGGALGAAIFDWAMDAHVGFSIFASLGSMIDIDFSDLIDFLGNDPETRSIMLYMEEVVHAKKFMSAARGFAHNKPIMVVKPGRFKLAPRTAFSHTGTLVTCDQVYDAAFQRAGVVRVKEIADFFNTVTVLHSKQLPKGPRLAILTNVGWVGVMATDALLELGGKLAELSENSMDEMNVVLPALWSHGNPIDILGDADVERYEKVMAVCLNDPGVDGLLVIFTPQYVVGPEELAAAVVKIAGATSKPIITAWMGGKTVEQARGILLQNTIPTYDTPEDAVKTYLYMVQHRRNLELLYETPAELSVDQAPAKNHLKALIRKVIKEGRTILYEEESKRFLANYGIPAVSPRLANNVEGAISIAKYVGYPVVLKIVSPDITYKSDAGGVITGINSEERLKVEYENLLRKTQEALPRVRIGGITVQKMIEGIDYEIILGAKKDPNFGAVILFGMGGTAVQIYRDYSLGLVPLNQTLAKRLMEETEVYRMLQGYRGKPPADLRQLEQIVVRFSNLIVDFPEIAEMDVNPIAIADGKAVALDARIIIDPGALGNNSETPYPHLAIAPYPTRYMMTWRLTDGTEVLIRPIRPEDEPLEYELLTSCSRETLSSRFLEGLEHVTHEMLTRVCNIDYEREIEIVAEVRDRARRRLIGTARLTIEPDFGSGQFGLLVHDDYQGKGLGYKLSDTLIGIAQEKGLAKFRGYIFTENKRMVKLVKKLGFTVEHLSGGLSRAEMKLQ